jgi:hypothetical protein
MGILLEIVVIRGRLSKSSGVWIMSRASAPCTHEHRLHTVTTAEHGPLYVEVQTVAKANRMALNMPAQAMSS